ncbi:MAG: hypothetical protein H0U65_15430 [Rubrobacter sp.]|nr:hypothetical protein [Rubrobacter sp.]
MAGNIRVPVPFETLLGSVSELSLEDKILLRDSLDEQIEADAEESPQTEADIRAARAAYESEDYVGIGEYIAKRRGES